MNISLGSEETYSDSIIISYQKIALISYDFIEMRAYISIRKSILDINLHSFA
jgi:hypothetical protein